MFKNLSKEQLSRLVMHTTGINNVLLEAMLSPGGRHESDFDDPPVSETEVGIEILVIDPAKLCGQQRPEPKPLNLDALCGTWTGGKKKPELKIFKAEPGYMAAVGKPDKRTGIQDCYLIHEVGGNLRFCSDEYVYLHHDAETDILRLWPGGEYTRVPEKK
jgi:hypothetical protein